MIRAKCTHFRISLDNLSPDEKRVVAMRFGLGEKHTLDEIAKELRITKDRARRLLVHGLEKLPVTVKDQLKEIWKKM